MNPSILSSEMARIFSLIGSLCSTGSMRLNLAQIPGSAGFQPASEKDWLKQIDSPKIFSAQRHGTQASGLCAKRTFCPLSAGIEAECNSAGRTDLEVYVPNCEKSSPPVPARHIRHSCRIFFLHECSQQGMLRMDEQNARAPKPMLKAIFFDAVGTLFYLTKTVGDHYAFVGEEVGLSLNAKKLDAAFHSAWKQMPPREAIDSPREKDRKSVV